jgi:hypothetical protein
MAENTVMIPQKDTMKNVRIVRGPRLVPLWFLRIAAMRDTSSKPA